MWSILNLACFPYHHSDSSFRVFEASTCCTTEKHHGIQPRSSEFQVCLNPWKVNIAPHFHMYHIVRFPFTSGTFNHLSVVGIATTRLDTVYMGTPHMFIYHMHFHKAGSGPFSAVYRSFRHASGAFHSAHHCCPRDNEGCSKGGETHGTRCRQETESHNVTT